MAKTLQEMAAEVKRNNVEHGWYDEERSFGEDVALLHSEVSEAFEAYRDHGLKDMTEGILSKPEGVGSELADVLIRLIDTCSRSDIDLEREYERKMAHNRTRPYRHGGKIL